LLGWLILLPVTNGARYASYRTLFPEEAVPAIPEEAETGG